MLRRLIPILFLLTSCSGTGGMIPVSDQMVQTSVDGVTKQLGYITDASAMKEKFVHDSLQNRDKMIAKSHAGDGFHMTFAMVEVAPGVKALLPQEISYKEQARFDQPLPVAPSVHPGWKTAERIGVAAIQGTVIGFGINATSDVLQSGIAASRSNNTTITDDHTVGAVDNSRYTEIDASRTDNSNGPVDNSIGPVDNSAESVGPVDNSVDNSAIIPTQE